VVRPTRTTRLLLGAGAVAVLGWLALRWWIQGGRELPMLPWTAPAVMGLLAIAVLVSGWQVRQWTRGRRERALDPLRAARTVVLAKAAQYAGALLSGWYAAQALAVLPTVDVEPRRGLLVRGLVSLAAAVVLWVVGWLVERWCRVPVDDDDKAPPSQGATA
jgi:Protein of unknown function (DUF3180)